MRKKILAAAAVSLAAAGLTAFSALLLTRQSDRHRSGHSATAIANQSRSSLPSAPARPQAAAQDSALRHSPAAGARQVAARAPKSETHKTLMERIRERLRQTVRGDLGGESKDAYFRWFHRQRAYPAETIPRNALAKALQSAQENNGGLRGAVGDIAVPNAIEAGVWAPLGPSTIPDGQTDTGAGPTLSPVSGRISAIAVHPTDPNIVYTAGAQGGVWKSTNALSATPTWTPLTDHQPSLAVGDIAIDPVNPQIIYVGTGEANGSCDSYYGRGILRSDDGGATWTQLGAAPGGPFDTNAISRILIDPATAGSTTTTTLWASAVVGFISSGTEQCDLASTTWNGALWRSTDSGANWTLQNVPTGIASPGVRIHDIALDPTNANTLYVAVRPTPTPANGGVWKSTNAKAATPSFAKLATGFPDTTTASPAIRRITLGIGGSGAPGTLYAALESLDSTLFGVYKTTDGGANWTHIQSGNGTGTLGGSTLTATTGTFATDGSWEGRRIILNGNISRTIQTVTNSTHLTLSNPPAGGPYNWSTGAYPTFCDGQCFYDMTVGVDPTDATGLRVFVGGNPNTFASAGPIPADEHSLWRTTNGGGSWSPVSQGSGTGGLHVDDHAIEFDASTTPARVYDGNDGGIWRSNDSGASWVTMNTNIAVTQFQSVSLHPSNRGIVLGGTQDNGTNIMNSAFQPPPKWFHADFGDGGQAIIDQSNPNRMLHTYFNASGVFMGPAKSTTGGSGGPGTWTFVGSYAGYGVSYYNGMNPLDPVSFYAPLAEHPAYSPNVIYFGSNKLYRSPDPLSPLAHVPSWTVKSPALAGGGEFLSAIGVLPNLVSAKEVVYTGASDGQISVTSNMDNAGGLATWTTISGAAPLPARFVTEIEVDAGDATGNTAVAAFSGFNANTPTRPGHVFRTVNGLGGAATWSNISGDLPDVPVNAIAIDPTKSPHVLYAGTDVGVFQSVNDGTNWTWLTNGHPNVSVFGLDRHPATGQVVSSTHGRGMFELITSGLGTSFYTLSPCRVADTRNAPGPSGGPALAANTNRSFPVSSVCGIPASATAVAINMAVVFPTHDGDLRLYPAGTTAPLASAINFRPGIVRANNAVVPLGVGGMISVQCDMPSGATDFFFDIYGYFQ